jgi:hypothetical protein
LHRSQLVKYHVDQVLKTIPIDPDIWTLDAIMLRIVSSIRPASLPHGVYALRTPD